MLILSTLLAAVLYSSATFMQWQTLKGARPQSRNLVRGLGAAGIAAHTLAVYLVLHPDAGIHLGFFSVGSLISWLVAALVLVSSLRQLIDNLFVAVFPLATLTALLAAFAPHIGMAKQYEAGVIAHILLSIMAYSIFTIAILQAVLLSRQEYALKHHQTRGLVASLPPLQTMERLLFELLSTGWVLLTASLSTGFIYLDDLFAQHLVHKTVLSLLAWVLFGVLLGGRHFFGWRSHTAIRWTVGGFVTLALAFFGSKLVLELIV